MARIIVNIRSNALGDTIAAMPYIDKYREVTGDHVLVSLNPGMHFMFKEAYPKLELISREYTGEFDRDLSLHYRFDVAVQAGYAEQLGFSKPAYIRPVIEIPDLPRPVKAKYVAIGVHSTAQLKYWNHPAGRAVQPEAPNLNDLCSLIRKAGYTPVVIDKYLGFGNAPFFNGLPQKANRKIDLPLAEAANFVKHAEFYIGPSSGMAWVAHALGKRVAMIANFTEDWNEFDLSLPDYKRISNKSVCHGCWNKPDVHKFDAQDWYWCPLHKGTSREFECHKSITPQMVWDEISEWLD